MKRNLISLLIVVVLMFTGCNQHAANSYTAYYPNILNGANRIEQVLGTEERLLPKPGSDLKGILNEYLQGPTDIRLENPFPTGSAVMDLSVKQSGVSLTLNSKFASLADIDLTVACACLAKTVISVTGTQTVVLKASETFSDGSIYKAYSADSFLTDDETNEIGNTSVAEE